MLSREVTLAAAGSWKLNVSTDLSATFADAFELHYPSRIPQGSQWCQHGYLQEGGRHRGQAGFLNWGIQAMFGMQDFGW